MAPENLIQKYESYVTLLSDIGSKCGGQTNQRAVSLQVIAA
jgi:hypothetical protein